MNDKAYKWIIGLLMGVVMAVSGWAYTQSNQRVTRMERLVDDLIPTVSRIEEKVTNTEKKVENIERILEKPASP